MLSLLDQHPAILDVEEFGGNEEDIAALEEVLGHELPEELGELLRLTDGGTLHGPTRTIRLASVQELHEWAARGVMSELAALPFAQDDLGTVLVVDHEGDWGHRGSIYRLETGRRSIRGYPLGDALRIASSITELLKHVVAGRQAW